MLCRQQIVNSADRNHPLVRQHQGLANAVYHVVTDKPLADLYIDDRAWRPPWADRPAEKPEKKPELDEVENPEEWTVVG